mmetsp:Transcript_103759/g.293321  ORF Transcript_103759/g.293321 Transcript_103759/m.293321 type:complete len:100 (+) Transcript_103759:238-537(+)
MLDFAQCCVLISDRSQDLSPGAPRSESATAKQKSFWPGEGLAAFEGTSDAGRLHDQAPAGAGTKLGCAPELGGGLLPSPPLSSPGRHSRRQLAHESSFS